MLDARSPHPPEDCPQITQIIFGTHCAFSSKHLSHDPARHLHVLATPYLRHLRDLRAFCTGRVGGLCVFAALRLCVLLAGWEAGSEKHGGVLPLVVGF